MRPPADPGPASTSPRIALLALALACLVAVASALSAGDVAAQIRVAEWGDGELDLTGYVRALTAVRDAGFDLPGAERTTAFAGQIARLKWTARGEDWVLEVHDRLQGRVVSEGGPAGGSVVGFGVSAVPDRTVDLETVLAEEEHLRIAHDVDRLALTLYFDAADVTVGRQAITWGLSSLFPVADLWSRFSPFELDTEEKPGIDAVRVLTYPGGGLELDAVLADRGSAEELSAGVRATATFASGDLWLGGGKFWRQAMALAGGSWLLDEVKLRAEAVVPWELEDVDGDGDDGLDRPRITIGADWIRGEWLLTGELHLNGVGADDPSAYDDLLAADPRLARGESYYLGRLLAGLLGSWRITDRLSVSATTLVNLQDPSLSLTPAAVYDLGQNARISLGGLLSGGERPVVTSPSPLPALEFRSEFGSYGTLGWTRVSLYF